MLFLLNQGQWQVFALLIISLILSLSFHEFGHAIVAKWQGDTTAQQAGRLTLNPLAHIDPFGLLMVVFVGFGYAKPVPTDPRNFTSRYSTLWVAAAGPFMNLVVAVVSINVYVMLLANGLENEGMMLFFTLLTHINLLLMLFNLIPLGPLDGHYMLPYFLPRKVAAKYAQLNLRYGTAALMGLIVLSIVGLPIFGYLMRFAQSLVRYIVFV
ncbi:MAG: site-2 protease family protein [Gammaproteobacteria bacterium]|nr:site-2 protease family protein [Gammaproteobacteria bacterium]